MNRGINVGHDREAIEARGKIVLDVLASQTGDNVKVAALKALTKMLSINGVSISDVSVVGDETHNHYPAAPSQEK